MPKRKKPRVSQVPLQSNRWRSISPTEDGQGTLQSDEEILDDDNIKINESLSVLGEGPLDVVHIIEDFTHDNYLDLLETLAKQHPRRFLAKLIYLYDDNALLIMNKSCLHSTVINTFNRLIGKFPIAIDHDDYVHQVLVSTIGHLDYNAPRPFKGDERGGSRTEGGNLIAAFPDFLLKIQVNATIPQEIPKWVGEVAFTTSASRTRDQLKDVITSNPTVDLAFLFVIDESPKWESPTNENSFAQQLSTQPVMKYVDFNHKADGNGMGPISFGEITWASVSRVALEVYMRSPENGALTIDEDEQSNLYSARGLLYPSISMDEVDHLLAGASEAFKTSFLAVIESGTGKPEYIEQVRQSKASLVIPWNNFLLSLRTGVFECAYERYTRWHTRA